jgi:pimeloyl-ACP methyl ester carboxylesterase
VPGLAGARDETSAAPARRLADSLANARVVVVPGAGHALPLEAPAAVAAACAAA